MINQLRPNVLICEQFATTEDQTDYPDYLNHINQINHHQHQIQQTIVYEPHKDLYQM